MNREAYTAPEANWILLVPAEDLMLGETSKEDAFAMGGWDDREFGPSVITGGGSSVGDGE